MLYLFIFLFQNYTLLDAHECQKLTSDSSQNWYNRKFFKPLMWIEIGSSIKYRNAKLCYAYIYREKKYQAYSYSVTLQPVSIY